MDIENLQTFIRVAETGSFSKSAESMNLTQPAVSKRIAALESQLDARLFDRVGRTVQLTEAGGILLPGAKKIQSEVLNVREVMSRDDGQIGGYLKIGTTPYLASASAAPWLAGYNQSFNQVKLDLSLCDAEQLVENTLNQSLDLALVPLLASSIQTPSDSLRCDALWTRDVKIVASTRDPLASREVVTPDDLAASRGIIPQAGTLARKAIDSELALSSAVAEVSVNADDFPTMRTLASIGLGWTCLPESEIDDTLVVLNVQGFCLTHTVAMIRCRERTLSRAADAFVKSVAPDARGISVAAL